jgi:hypothetical protein
MLEGDLYSERDMTVDQGGDNICSSYGEEYDEMLDKRGRPYSPQALGRPCSVLDDSEVCSCFNLCIVVT